MNSSQIAVCSKWTQLEAEWLTPFQDEQNVWVMLENPTEEVFKELSACRKLLLESPVWAQGRVFSERHELKWRKRFEQWHAVFFSDDPKLALPAGFEVAEGVLVEKVDVSEPEGQVVLWGERREGRNSWLEDRIPRSLHYPVQALGREKRVVLLYTVYRLTGPGQMEPSLWNRYYGVKAL